MSTLEMPRLTGSRLSAQELADQLPAGAGDVVTLDARAMEAASQSFADEIIFQVLVNRGASQLEVLLPTERFARHLSVSAMKQGLAGHLRIVSRTRDESAGR